ncbi:FtsW/RodA/SpoVE family cell cycle protein [Embleya sp. NPDC005971]|uniref:FtsW/RodA/SpoVE family cell cycle protein n=2 Tax=unclassified Embleya TaxID=2699296 RepID=UPI0034036C06
MTDRPADAGPIPNRRGTELTMLGFAVLVTVLAYANVGLAGDGSLPAGMVGYSLGIGAPALLGHLAIRRFAPYADPLLLPLATLLNGIGMVLIYRIGLDPVRGQKKALQTASTQLVWSAMGIALFLGIVVLLRDHRVLQRYTYTAMALSLVLLVSPIPFPAVNGAKIWVALGPFSLQPGEFTKIVLTVFFAGYLMAKRDALALAGRTVLGMPLPRGRDLGPILAAWLLSLLILVFERDLGTSLLFFGVFVVLLYIATERTSWLVFGLVLSATGAVLVGSVEPHVKSRVHAWLDPMYYYDLPKPGLTDSDQAAQALFGFGSGGMLGTGLNQGHPGEIGFAANSDFILTSVGEELGLAGMMAIFMVYALLIERGLRTALAARDPFGKLLAAGLAVVMALQVFVVAGGVIGLIPLTGMTMPFLAQGGSSVITNWGLVAVLIVISHAARRPLSAVAAGEISPTQNSRGGGRHSARTEPAPRAPADGPERDTSAGTQAVRPPSGAAA